MGDRASACLNEVRSWRPEQSVVVDVSGIDDTEIVSMKSGLRDRNNRDSVDNIVSSIKCVSMKSGLRDRNNIVDALITELRETTVSMKSGLRDRNNIVVFNDMPKAEFVVSMKSGLRDRNNFSCRVRKRLNAERLNEVRSWRPEQSESTVSCL